MQTHIKRIQRSKVIYYSNFVHSNELNWVHIDAESADTMKLAWLTINAYIPCVNDQIREQMKTKKKEEKEKKAINWWKIWES